MMFSHPDNTEYVEYNSDSKPEIQAPKRPEPFELKVYEEVGLPKWVDYLLVGAIAALFAISGLVHLLKT